MLRQSRLLQSSSIYILLSFGSTVDMTVGPPIALCISPIAIYCEMFALLYYAALFTFNTYISNFKISLQLRIAGFDAVQLRVSQPDFAFRTSRAASIQQRQNILIAAEKERIISMRLHKAGMNFKTSSGLHTSPAR